MTLVSPGWRRALAMLVIAQGLTHAATLRPAFDPGNFVPFILYGVAVVGFTTAGIGIFGLTPFTSVVRPLLVVASGYSLVLLSVIGGGATWVPVLDVVLLLAGVTGLYNRLPLGASHPGLPHRMAVAAGAVFVLAVFVAVVSWRG